MSKPHLKLADDTLAEPTIFELWFEADQAEKLAAAKKKALRPEVERMLADGELVGNDAFYLTYSEATSFDVDIEKMTKALGPDIVLRCADVSSAKFRKLIDAGVIKESEVKKFAKAVTTQKLMLKKRND
jgi:hypothetical protein